MTEGRQTSFFDVLFVDSFAGGGGASTGIEMATGHPVDIAINHDESAIMMHKRNHPYTEHYREDIWKVDPIQATHGQRVRLAWFSPDCKHFSRAKGAALVDKHIRGLAWVVLRWAGTVRPDVIMLENVPEFVTWGPVRKGKPIKSKAGQTYRKWHQQLSDLGYKIESRELCAADYGAPTIRTRFCLIARCDGKPIVWPERTHAPADSLEVQAGKCKPWRAAAEIINWGLPCYSIFETKQEIKEKYGADARRPLRPNTMQRIARGLDKFAIKAQRPYIVECNHAGDHYQSADRPLNTITAKYTGGLVMPTLTQYHTERHERETRGQKVDEPLRTIDAANRYGLGVAYLTEYYGSARPGIDVLRPMQTITAKDRENLTVAYIQKYFSGVDGADLRNPMPTITAVDHNSLTAVHIAKFKGKDKGQTVREPLQTITASAGEFALIQTTVQKYSGAQDLKHWPQVRELLNLYCGYELADDEILLLGIAGSWYFISDIGLRMLTPRELYDAMGFPHDYIIDRDVGGRPISRADQVARCGNAVCPAVSEAMVRANLPECAKQKYGSMEILHEAMTS